MFGFFPITTAPFAVGSTATIEVIAVSEGVTADALVSSITSSNVSVSETFEASTTANGLLSIQVDLSDLVMPQDTPNASADLVAGVFEDARVFVYVGISGEYAVFNNETAEVSDTALGNTSSNVSVQETASVDAEEARRLLWENIDDAQNPDWRPIDTN
jgi:hypothetical protein